MSTKKYITELVVYKIKPETAEKYAAEIIDHFRKLVMSFDGFISYEFLQSCRDRLFFMDLVLWDTLENAENAAKKVKEIQKEERYKDYLESFEKVKIFDHFKPISLWKKTD